MFDSSVNQEENNGGMSYKTLIPVRIAEIGGEAVRVCNAKDIFLCLRVRSRFNDWITRRISEYGFIENEDFALVTPEKVTKGRGGDRRSKQYNVSLDMAKELALVERGEVGQRIRRYFIACEKALRQIAPEVAADCLHKALNPQQQFQLKEKVDSKVACLAKARQRAGYHEIWSSLKSRHQVAQYRDIPQGEFEDACQYVESYVWEGEWLEREQPAAEGRLGIHYPVSRWLADNPELAKAQMQQGSLLLSAQMLYGPDYRSPMFKLLTELTKAGYNVAACQAEAQAMRHHVETMDVRLGEIFRQTMMGRQRGIRINVQGEGRMVA